jgi:hypothetical protein
VQTGDFRLMGLIPRICPSSATVHEERAKVQVRLQPDRVSQSANLSPAIKADCFIIDRVLDGSPDADYPSS